jgi:hypothetical protein
VCLLRGTSCRPTYVCNAGGLETKHTIRALLFSYVIGAITAMGTARNLNYQ